MQASAPMALMEWEFTEGPDNEGQFMATGKVIETLRRHLAKNEIDEAVALYETCVQQTVGQEVWQEFETASTPTKKAIANLFFRSRDYQRAAAACEQLGEWTAASRAYAAASNWSKAAQCMQKNGDDGRAALLYLKGGDARRAAELYFNANRLLDAGAALEVTEDLVGAGQMFIRAGDLPRAAQALSRVTMEDPRFMSAVVMLSEVLLSMNRRDLAIQRLSAVVDQEPTIREPVHADVVYRLARLLADEGQVARARDAFERLYAYDAGYRDVVTRLEAMGRSTVGARPPTGSVPTAPASSDRPVQPNGAGPAISGVQSGVIQRMAGYDVLKRLPIFEDLTLDEMKAFYTVCEQAMYRQGEVVIEQGQPGVGLIIVRQGSLRVTRVDDGGRQVELAMVPAGQYVGEMSLADDVPTSARVSAATTVRALRITKERFERFLFAHEKIAVRIYRSFLKTLSRRLRDQNDRRSG